MIDLPVAEQPAIVVTASRAEEQASETPVSVSLIDGKRIERMGSPLVPELLRLVPSVAVATSGPAGSQTQVRIRGAEANHTLLFIEGIRANDPAAGNEPRFELLNADLASRIEVVRGPQSALWGSEAIGGVVAVSGEAPGSGGTLVFVEGGSHAAWRGAARTTYGGADRGFSIGVAGQRSDGIDSFDGTGDKDGYNNLGLRVTGRYRLSPALLLGASGFALKAKSEFDGFDPFTFLHADTLDETHNQLGAGRLFAELGDRERAYAIASASLLGSSNRNELDGDFLNKTEASRRTLGLEGGYRFGNHRLIAAAESEHERFEANDVAFGGFTNQDRSRNHQSLTVEWRGEGLGPIDAGLAIRQDIFSRFKDATSFRASVKTNIASSFAIAANYGEGIAQPTFFDLYGFFPGSFAGNAGLRPESSRGGDISLRYSGTPLGGSVTYFRQRLKDEIATVFLPDFTSTAVNANGKSKRQGIELEMYYQPFDAFRLTATYAWLDASEPDVAGSQIREPRRPRHSGSIAVDGSRGRLTYGAAIAYTGERSDTNFNVFPAAVVRFGPYWLASARLAYRLTDQLEAHLRVANAFDDRYQDVVGYRTEGRTIHAGLRLALGG